MSYPTKMDKNDIKSVHIGNPLLAYMCIANVLAVYSGVFPMTSL